MIAPASTVRSRGSDWRRAGEHALLGGLPVLLAVRVLISVAGDGQIGIDFHRSFWVAAHHVLEGTSPYVWPRHLIVSGVSFPYPAVAALTLEPLALLPQGVASAIALGVCLAMIPLALRLVGVMDWRVYGAAMLWLPVVLGWQCANFTLPLACGLACLWRWRDRPETTGVVTAILISIKPIMLPLGLWLLATRRYRAAAWSLGTGLVVNGLGWTVLGWGELHRWLNLLSLQSRLMYRIGYGIVALAGDLGMNRTAGTAIAVIASAALAVVCVRLGRTGREAAAFAIATVLTITISPQVDNHYFALLAVPLAIVCPRLSVIWFVPLLLWGCPSVEAPVALWRESLFWVGIVAVTVRVLADATEARPVPPRWLEGPFPKPA